MRLLVGAHTRNLQGTQKVVGHHSIHVEEVNYFMEESDLHAIKGDMADARQWPSVEISMLISVTPSLSTAMRGTLEDDQPPLSRFQPPQVAGRLDIQE